MVRLAVASSFVLGSVALLADAPAQTAWGERRPATVPPARHAHVLVFDPVRQRTLLFGGADPSNVTYADTWEWDGQDWTLMNPATSPPSRWGAAACFDEARGRVILCGGKDGATVFGDTWEWTGTTWQILFTNGPVLFQHGVAFDSTLGQPVLFGGLNQTISGEMWRMTSTGWQPMNPPSLPPGTHSHIMCADPHRREILIDGGSTPGTWIWDGTTWTRPASTRPHHVGSAAAYDALRRRIVVFEGQDTWEWTGTTWLRRWPGLAPPPRVNAGLAYDAVRRRVLMFGGQVVGSHNHNDTWEYHLFAPAAYASYNQGCIGTIGQRPLLAPRDGALPWIGETFTLDLTRLPPLQANVPFGVVGSSRTSWLGIPLPLDLGFAGAPGCLLLTSADTSLTPLTNMGGRATWVLSLPLDLRTLGVPFYVQAAVFDFGANALNLVVSNGGAAVPGMK